MQNIVELKHCHDVAKCKTVLVESQSESHQVSREHHLWHPSWPMKWQRGPCQTFQSRQADRQVSGTHGLVQIQLFILSHGLVIDSSSYIVACTPELAGLECCDRMRLLWKIMNAKMKLKSLPDIFCRVTACFSWNSRGKWRGSDQQVVQVIFKSFLRHHNWWGLRSRGGEDGHGGGLWLKGVFKIVTGGNSNFHFDMELKFNIKAMVKELKESTSSMTSVAALRDC